MFPPSTSFRLLQSSLIWVLLCSILSCQLASAVEYVETENSDGETVYLRDDRRPALYTGTFGDCMGDSLVNVSRFDAAYYKDNMTVSFHLEGTTAIKNESLMLYVGVYAYGESRFTLTLNPCNTNIPSLCPLNASVPIEASATIPVGEADVESIPDIAFTVPDFEGDAILRIFANSTETQIGCFSAVVKNGHSFSHPKAVGSTVGVFVLVALVASFATAIHGDQIPAIRTHYAHSLSMFVVFSIFHHIYFTGALSINWPSVLPAFWNNFAWAGGMIYVTSMQNTINAFIGSNKGNLTSVGSASADSSSGDMEGFSISDIYRRADASGFWGSLTSVVFHPDMSIHKHFADSLRSRQAEHTLAKRLANSTNGYKWYGEAVKDGLPLPGNYSGFAGTLSEQDIPAANAFMTAFLWFLILIALVAAAVVLFKGILECLCLIKILRPQRLAFFRRHWIRYTVMAVLRTSLIGFFTMTFLTLFEFAFRGPSGVTAVAAFVFAIFFVGMVGSAFYAWYYGAYLTSGRPTMNEPKSWWKVLSSSGRCTTSSSNETDLLQNNMNENEEFLLKFGWLSARFRRTRWWFFAAWLSYEFIRACFYGGAVGQPHTQLYGLLVIEIIALAATAYLRPFEGVRLNALMIYILGFSKIVTLALSISFDSRYGISRIITTVIGIVIIVVQCILVIALLIAIIVGAISSYMSITKDRDPEAFRPRKWVGIRTRYLAHVDRVAKDLPRPPRPPTPPPEEPKPPYFSVNSVKRYPKIEDEDEENEQFTQIPDVLNTASVVPEPAQASATPSATPSATRANRSASMASMRSQLSYANLPFGARPHRASWSSRDFTPDGEPISLSYSNLGRMRSDTSLSASRNRAPSRTSMGPRSSATRLDLSIPEADSEGPMPASQPLTESPTRHVLERVDSADQKSTR